MVYLGLALILGGTLFDAPNVLAVDDTDCSYTVDEYQEGQWVSVTYDGCPGEEFCCGGICVTNGGVRPLRIEKVKSGCAGCIVIISFPTEPIRRGESVPIRIALNSESLKGRTRKSLVIISNDPIRSVYPMLIGAVVEQQELPETK